MILTYRQVTRVTEETVEKVSRLSPRSDLPDRQPFQHQLALTSAVNSIPSLLQMEIAPLMHGLKTVHQEMHDVAVRSVCIAAGLNHAHEFTQHIVFEKWRSMAMDLENTAEVGESACSFCVETNF